MGWMQALCETYDNYFSAKELADDHPLVPAGFIEKELNIRVNLKNGAFHSARILEQKERLSVPTSPMAEGRTGPPIAYPLCDELRYVSGDLTAYTNADHSAYHEAYIAQLRDWCAAADAPAELKTLLRYLEKNCLVKDLVDYGVLFADENGKLIDKWQGKKDKPAFYGLNKPAEKCVVDFAVLIDDKFVLLSEIEALRTSWRNALLGLLTEKQLCYVDGVIEPVIYNHAKIEGNAKLISAKDGFMDFQFKGRFKESEQACAVSYAASAKAHNTLRWLRARQGFSKFGSTFIAWSTVVVPKNESKLISPLQLDTIENWGAPDEDEKALSPDPETAYSTRVRKALEGYKSAPEFNTGAHIIMLGMEAATPGRMSLNYYQELDGSAYLDRLNEWYTSCLWLLSRKNKEDVYYTRVTTPTPQEIIEAVFGAENASIAARDSQGSKSITKQIKSFNITLLSCIANGRPVPLSAVNAAFHRACRPFGFTNQKGKWQRFDWLKCVAVTCAMEKNHNKEGFKVPLNKTENDTSYLYGRLMAVADCAELLALAVNDSQHRQTNAIRYFSAVQQRPAATWKNVEIRLMPYLTKLGKGDIYYRKILDEIGGLFKDGEMEKNDALSPYFLQGYHCQREEILREKEKKEQNNAEGEKQ